ncbi:MAG TPA: hypothetical protein DD381_09985 [Lentisphaeria bacterium]|nr:MAG: hypothetical protein A2X47_13970 [Lentisphaerae bacterium GWF2_38_69]HBM16653.1 hypothetical protein [Lentisphaeria bacterium]
MKRKHEAAFKAQVAIAAIKEEETLGALAGKYGVHSNCISNWKQVALENVKEGFSRNSKKKKDEEEITRDDLLREIGQLKMENEFLKKKHKQLFG